MSKDLRILVAEDDADDRFLMQRAFSKAGITVPIEFAHDGQQTIDALQNSQNFLSGSNPSPTLLLLDLKMPTLDGFQVLEWLNEHRALRPALVVIFTSSSDPKDKRRAQELGADSYIVKPNDSLEYVNIARDLERQLVSIANSRVAES